ncbi:ABC transporter ATP-binding protein [Butyrivibrio sp. MC2013]|uniref:ABC transporter ATP-binding protein n=1 Tax=Butyrivibrio sp. MC2013 TaxID=1280686 RepID=UPI000406010E|nr:ABC transporter ATP-binding protein [Butyrivibrio sp. MC2013]
MSGLLKYLKAYKVEAFLAPMLKLLEVCFELAVPLVMASIIDEGIGSGNSAYVLKMGLLLVILGILGLAAAATAQFFSAKAAVGFGTGVRHALFEHIGKLSFGQVDQLGTDTLIGRITGDINEVQGGVNMFLRLFMRSPFVVFGAMIMAFTVDPSSAVIFVIIIPLLAIVVFSILLITIPLYKKVQSRLDKVLTRVRENLTGVRVIRAFGKEPSEKDSFEEDNALLIKLELFTGRISALLNPLTFIMINIAIIFLLSRGAVRIDSGLLSTGQLVALVNYMSQILVELVKLANLIIQITRALACAQRINDVLQIAPEMTYGNIDTADNKAAYAVEFRNVSLAYNNDQEDVLENIDIQVKKGETIGIIGGTGSGKSSLISLIPRFYDASAGEVMVFGHNVKDYNLDSLREMIGVVLQKARLFKGTIAENLSWGLDNADEDDMRAALSTAQALDFVEQKEGRLGYRLEQNAGNLSGGQKQRLSIARALIRKPRILILDDSASALDYATDARLRQSIAAMDPDITTFIVSQRAASVINADQIIVLDDGRICGKGTHDELLSSCEVYQEIYYSQFPKGES